VGLAEGVATGDQRDGLLVVHRHAREGLADVAGGGERIGVAARALGVDVDEAHLHGGQRVGQLAVTAVALIGQPGALAAPVDRGVGLPGVGAAAGEAERLKAHGLEGDVAGQDHEVGPRQVAAVLLLDRPQEAPGLVEVGVVGPARQRREPLLTAAGSAAAIADAVGAGAVPGQTHEQRTVVPEVGGPPRLRVGHERGQVALDRGQIERAEGRGVVEAGAHGIGGRRRLVQDPEVELLWPPVGVGGGPAARVVERTLRLARLARHGSLP
jgi:hypothetical protein